jgi:hypothetical protein
VSDEAEGVEAERPFLRVIAGGEPTAEETAALVAALAVVSAQSRADEAAPPSQWASREAALRRPLRPGPGAWVASARR